MKYRVLISRKEKVCIEFVFDYETVENFGGWGDYTTASIAIAMDNGYKPKFGDDFVIEEISNEEFERLQSSARATPEDSGTVSGKLQEVGSELRPVPNDSGGEKRVQLGPDEDMGEREEGR